MATYVPPKRATAFRFAVSLFAQANNQIKITPTLAAGDVKVSKDFGALANITTLPTEAPASSGILQVDLSATEMTADIVTVRFIDAAGAEWNDLVVSLPTTARQIDDLAYPATSGRSMVVDAAGLVDANTVKIGPTGSGTAQTARDVGASVLLSAGTGTGQLDFTSGVVKANLVQILATALTETAGQLAGGFKKLFDVTSPVMTLLSVNQTGDSYARLGAPAGASHAADTAAVKTDTAAIKVQTDKLTFTVANQLDSNVLDWKSATAPAMTGDAFARLGAPAGASVSADVAAVKTDTAATRTAVGTAGAGLTALGDTRIANLDAAVSSRLASSSYTAPPSAATVAQAVWDVLTSALTTVGSIGKLLVTNLDAAISSRSTYAGADTSGTTTLLSRLTSTRAGLLDNLDATVSSRLASGSYTAPDNTSVAAIKAKTDNLPASPAATSDIPTANITAIKAKTDSLAFTVAGQVDSNIKSVAGTTVTGSGTAGSPWGP